MLIIDDNGMTISERNVGFVRFRAIVRFGIVLILLVVLIAAVASGKHGMSKWYQFVILCAFGLLALCKMIHYGLIVIRMRHGSISVRNGNLMLDDIYVDRVENATFIFVRHSNQWGTPYYDSYLSRDIEWPIFISIDLETQKKMLAWLRLAGVSKVVHRRRWI